MRFVQQVSHLARPGRRLIGVSLSKCRTRSDLEFCESSVGKGSSTGIASSSPARAPNLIVDAPVASKGVD